MELHAPLVPGHAIGHALGRGGSGEVWLAWPEDRGSAPVAIKVVDRRPPQDGARHPDLLAPSAVVDLPAGRTALILPYLAGGSLADLLAERGSLTAGEVVALLGPIVDAVGAIHAAGATHGDLKPANVLLRADGSPVVADALVPDESAGGEANGRAALPLLGTPAYLAPEVDRAGRRSPASDLFALGVIAYEALTGVRPHRGSAAVVVAAASAGAHRPLSSWRSVDPVVAEIVEQALLPDPVERSRNLRAWVEGLRAAVPPRSVVLPGPVEGHGPPADPREQGTVDIGGPSRTEAAEVMPTSSRRRSRALLAGAGALALVIVIGAVGAGTRASDRPVAPRPSPPASVRPVARHGARPNSPSCRSRAFVVHRGQTLVDTDGHGCMAEARWRGGVLEVIRGGTVRRYAVGRPGDRALFGDWDGDGDAAIGYYRPSTGEVVYVDRLPRHVGDRVPPERITQGVPGGRARVVRTGGRYDRIDVTSDGGGR